MRIDGSGFLFLPLLLYTLAVLSGCTGDPHTSTYTVSRPRESDLVGTYVPTEDTTRLVTGRGGYEGRPAIITLGDGAAVEFTDVPDWWNTPSGKPGGGFDSAAGRWGVERKQDRWWAIGIEFPRGSRLASLGGKPVVFHAQVLLVGEKPPYRLHLTIGDPDEGIAMQFVKKP